MSANSTTKTARAVRSICCMGTLLLSAFPCALAFFRLDREVDDGGKDGADDHPEQLVPIEERHAEPGGLRLVVERRPEHSHALDDEEQVPPAPSVRSEWSVVVQWRFVCLRHHVLATRVSRQSIHRRQFLLLGMQARKGFGWIMAQGEESSGKADASHPVHKRIHHALLTRLVEGNGELVSVHGHHIAVAELLVEHAVADSEGRQCAG